MTRLLQKLLRGIFRSRTSRGNEVYWDGPSKDASHLIYLYYIYRESNDHFDMRTYFIERTKTGKLDQAEVLDWISKAKNEQLVPVGYQVKDLTWRHRAYLIFGMDDSNQRFKEDNAVIFTHQNIFGKNHSFRDGIDIKNAGDVSGMWCINQRIGKGGGKLVGSEVFDVDFPGFPMRLHAETGTNTGP